MASQGDKSTGKDEGEVKSTPSINQEVAPTLVSSTDTKLTKGTKLHIFIFCTVLFPFLTIVDEKIFLSKACFNRLMRKVLSLALLVFVFMNPIFNNY
jgi:hypothetical protein